MKPCYAVALTCCYFLGWAVVLAGLLIGGTYREPVFVAIATREDLFFESAVTALVCFSVPCGFVALGLSRELKSKPEKAAPPTP